MRSVVLVLLLQLIKLVASSSASNRTSCFLYITCMENAHHTFQECVGSTALALALEEKEKPFADFLSGRESKARLCEERLASDSMDFEALQRLVYEDSRECFQHLPRSRHAQKNVTRECRWQTAPTTQSPGDGVLQCLETFRAGRKQCEEYLQCCPDHIRCGERMNTVSMAYKHAKSKANEIVERLLLCMGSLEPHTVLELAGMRVDRVHFRVPGVPFYKPDRATEERIARRLSMMSYATIDQKKDRFVKKFQATRDKLLEQKNAKLRQSSVLSTPISPITSEQRVAIVRNLFRNAKEKELAHYATLLAEGNFARLAEIEREKNADADSDINASQMQRIREASLLSKDQKSVDFLVPATLEEARREQSSYLLKEQTTDTPAIKTDAPFKAKKRLRKTRKNKEVIVGEKSAFPKSDSIGQELTNRNEKQHNTYFFGLPINLLKEDDILTSPHKSPSLKNVYKNQKVPLGKSTAVSVTSKRTTHKNGTTFTRDVSEDVYTSSQLPPASEGHTGFETTPLSTETLVDDVEGSGVLFSEEPTSSPASLEIVEEHETTHNFHEGTAALLSEKKEPEKEQKKPTLTTKKGKRVKFVGVAKEMTTTALVETTSKEAKVEEPGQREQEKSTEHASSFGDTASEENVETSNEEPVRQEPEGGTLKSTASLQAHILIKEETPKRDTFDESIEKTKQGDLKRVQKKFRKQEDARTNHVVAYSKDAVKNQEVLAVKTTEEKAESQKVKEDEAEEKVADLMAKVEDSKIRMEATSAVLVTSPSMTITEAGPPRRTRICARFAACMETIRDYEDQCEQRYSRDYLSHGIDDTDVLRILNASSISNGTLAHRACLRGVEKSVYATMKHLLVTQRSLRKACLEAGYDRNKMTADQILQCQKTLPSTEFIDDFLYKNHYRSEENRQSCHDLLRETKRTCFSLAGCCAAAIRRCEDQLKSSTLQERLSETTDRLIRRHNECEKNMVDTFKLFRTLNDDKRRI